MTAFVEEHRLLFTAATFAILAWAFYLTYRRRARSGSSKIMTFNKVMLWAATAMVIAFLFFPQAVTSLMASSDEFTTDMERTVVAVEGMT